MDADGEDLAVDGGADFGESGCLLAEARQLPARLLDGLLGAKAIRLLPFDAPRSRQTGPDQGPSLLDLRLLEGQRCLLFLARGFGVARPPLKLLLTAGESRQELALLDTLPLPDQELAARVGDVGDEELGDVVELRGRGRS